MANAQLDPEPGRPDHAKVSNNRLNAIRAAVLGANDGVVSVASIILGVAGATSNHNTIFTAGIAGLAAGAMSMAVGEYVSVSSQRDTERAYIAEEKWHLEHHPEEEFEDLATTFQSKGLSAETAHRVARELTDHDAIKAHLDAELGVSETELTSPVGAAVASLTAFAIGGAVPLVTIIVVNHSLRLIATFLAVIVALGIAGYLSATIGHASRPRAVGRVILGGTAAMLLTYGIGHLFGKIIG